MQKVVIKYADHANEIQVFDYYNRHRLNNVDKLTLTWEPGDKTPTGFIWCCLPGKSHKSFKIPIIVARNFDE